MYAIELVSDALESLDSWVEAENFMGWDPFDALNSPLLLKLTLGRRRLGQLWVQLMKRSPVNFRSLLRVPKEFNPKGMGLFLETYLRKYLMQNELADLERVRYFVDWLQAHASPGYSGACWGYNFDWPNRGFFAKAGTPTAVNTGFIGIAFVNLYRFSEYFLSTIQRDQMLDVARSACEFARKDLNHVRPDSGEICFSYTPYDTRYVTNASLLAAQLLAEVAWHTRESDLYDLACDAVRYAVRRQNSDGSWRYGEAAYDDWIDNFHTGFVLTALKRISTCVDIPGCDDSLERGYDYWKHQMFLPDGMPRYYSDRTYPVDIHAVAQGILTFIAFADMDSEAHERARQVARFGIENMQDLSGFFHYQIHRFYRNRIPYMRWSQAWMQRALIELVWSEFTKE